MTGVEQLQTHGTVWAQATERTLQAPREGSTAAGCGGEWYKMELQREARARPEEFIHYF